MTVAEWLRRARMRLSDDDSCDGEILLSAVTGKSLAAFIADGDDLLTAAVVARGDELLTRRVRGEPIAYIVGQKEFWSVPLHITPDVLIPRPETELLVEEMLTHAAHRPPRAILELGTGSGAIAIALARALPECEIVATDISDAALAVAANNAKQFAPQIKFARGDWFDALANQQFDFIVTNPPYIAPDDRHLTQGDVRFEPAAALVSAANGLCDLTKIITAAPAYLRRDGGLFVEHGFAQGAAVRELFGANGFDRVVTRRDLAGHERVTGGWR